MRFIVFGAHRRDITILSQASGFVMPLVRPTVVVFEFSTVVECNRVPACSVFALFAKVTRLPARPEKEVKNSSRVSLLSMALTGIP